MGSEEKGGGREKGDGDGEGEEEKEEERSDGEVQLLVGEVCCCAASLD